GLGTTPGRVVGVAAGVGVTVPERTPVVALLTVTPAPEALVSVIIPLRPGGDGAVLPPARGAVTTPAGSAGLDAVVAVALVRGPVGVGRTDEGLDDRLPEGQHRGAGRGIVGVHVDRQVVALQVGQEARQPAPVGVAGLATDLELGSGDEAVGRVVGVPR